MKINFELSERELQAILSCDHLGTVIGSFYNGPLTTHGEYSPIQGGASYNDIESKHREKLCKRAEKIAAHIEDLKETITFLESSVDLCNEEINDLKIERDYLESLIAATEEAGNEDLTSRYRDALDFVNKRIQSLEWGAL